MCIVCYVRPGSRQRILDGDTPKWISNRSRASYIAAICISAPPWVKPQEFRTLKMEALRLTLVTGRKHVLDHIIPVNNSFVCGLTVPWNMQVISSAANSHKGNWFAPDKLELF